VRTLLLLGLVACTPEEETGPVVPDVTAPELNFSAPSGPLALGQAVSLQAEAADDDGIFRVTAWYRSGGSSIWESVGLEEVDGLWEGEIPAERVLPPHLDLYVRAEDGSAFRTSTTVPDAGEGQPFQIEVVGEGLDLPYQQDFENAEGSLGLYDLGWAAVELGPSATWQLRRVDDSQLAYHRSGVDGVEEFDGWLLTPPLDLTSVDSVQLGWTETNEDAAAAQHELWISTGSSDPTSGDFEKVADLPAADGTMQAEPFDLTPWVGDHVVVAWRYLGGDAGTWGIDDVALDLHRPQLAIEATQVDDDLVLSVDNLGFADATDLAIELSTDVPWLSAEPLALARLDTRANAPLTLPLVAAPDAPEAAAASGELTITSAEGSWSVPVSLRVGDPVVAILELDTAGQASVFATVGTGNPELPLWSTPIAQDLITGPAVFEVDISEGLIYLPPSAAQRWWVRFEAPSSAEVVDFSVEASGARTSGSDVGPVDREGALFQLPERAVPEIIFDVTDPDVVAPGDQVTWAFEIKNRAGSTGSPVALDVVLGDGGTLQTGTQSFPTLVAQGVLQAEISLDVSAQHTNDLPIPAQLVLSSDDDAWVLETELEVPWPRVVAMGAHTELWVPTSGVQTFAFYLGNAGHLYSGLLNCTPNIGDVIPAMPSLNPGETAVVNVAVPVQGATSVVWNCTSDRGDYTLTYLLEEGQRPWLQLAPSTDVVGDSDGPDLLNTYWQRDGELLSFRHEFAAPFDPLTDRVEIYMSGSSDSYSYFQLIVAGGTATLYGNNGVLTEIPGATASIVGSTVTVSFRKADLDLNATVVSVGVGAGTCPSGDVYCDHLPDGWGSPYSGLSIQNLAKIYP